MLKLIGWMINTVFFALLVLVLGNWVRFDGKTVSDHVKAKMVWLDKKDVKSPGQVTEKVTQSVKKITDRVTFGNSSPSKKEREELKELIKKF
ncbi:MAG: hypothetical protein JNL01_04885 [Bdellovibrionales bacterium]|nr:hypothetical protein [Bdellovibrionales bacterium]